MRLAKWLFIILILFSVGHASATSLEYFEVQDSTNFSVDYSETDSLMPYIGILHIDPDSTSYISIDTDTFYFTTNLSVSTLKVNYDFQYQDKVTGNITTGSDSWFKTPFMLIYFKFGDEAEGMYPGSTVFESNVVGGSESWPHTLVLGPVYPSSTFTFESDSPVYLKWSTLDSDDMNLGFFDEVKNNVADLIISIPFIGEYVYQILSIVGSIVSAFVILAYISIKNWTFFLVLFESFVFFHATSILQNTRGKSSKVITESFKAIASDNKLLLDFLVSVFTQIINMFVGAVRMFRG